MSGRIPSTLDTGFSVIKTIFLFSAIRQERLYFRTRRASLVSYFRNSYTQVWQRIYIHRNLFIFNVTHCGHWYTSERSCVCGFRSWPYLQNTYYNADLWNSYMRACSLTNPIRANVSLHNTRKKEIQHSITPLIHTYTLKFHSMVHVRIHFRMIMESVYVVDLDIPYNIRL